MTHYVATESGGEIEIVPDTDPVCEATIDPDAAREQDLSIVFAEREYLFCGPYCLARFTRSPLDYASSGRGQP